MVLRMMFISLFAIPFTLFGQDEGQEILSHFSISQSGNAIRLILTIEAGTSSCNGIELERSTGGEYQTISLIPGICGGSEFEETYVLLDENPVPGVEASYRVNLGNVGRSSVLRITFVELDNGIAVFPNPASDRVNILASEELTDAEISIYDSQGTLVFTLEKAAIPGQFPLDMLKPGTYNLLVKGNGKSWKTKIILVE
jgi:hypothetical protein